MLFVGDGQAFVHSVAHIPLAFVVGNLVAATRHASQPDTATCLAVAMDKDVGNKFRIAAARQLSIYRRIGRQGMKTGFEVLPYCLESGSDERWLRSRSEIAPRSLGR